MRELDLLHHIYRVSPETGGVLIPPGDDMGSVRIGDVEVLVTVDQMADGVHFLLHETTLEKVGRKAVTRNLSDVAAMAAKPVGAVASVALPRDFGQARAEQLFEHMRMVAEDYQCPLFGGDITIWDHPLHMSVTVLAEPDGVAPVLRKGAQQGDLIFVTGELGGSLRASEGYVHHLDFEPRLSLARKLAGDPTTRPRCMLDLSDGLAPDVPRLLRMGEGDLAAIIELNALPVSQAARQASKDDAEAGMAALTDGEDYELCFMVPAERAGSIPAEIDGVPITRVGEVVARQQDDQLLYIRLADGGVKPLDRTAGWEHRGDE